MGIRPACGLVLFAWCAGCGGGVDDGARLVGKWAGAAMAPTAPEQLELRGDGSYAHGAPLPDRYRWDAGSFVADGAALHFDGRDAYDGSAVRLDIAYRLDGDALTLGPAAPEEALRSTAPPAEEATARVLHRVGP
jgi:hypothetical protein